MQNAEIGWRGEKLLFTTPKIGCLSMIKVHWMGGAPRTTGRSVDPARTSGPGG